MTTFISHHYPEIIALIVGLGAICLFVIDRDDSNWIDENDNPIPKEIIKHRREGEKTDKRLSKIYH